MYDPADFTVPLPFEAHRNPSPPMQWLHARWKDGMRNPNGQEAFMASEREIREAMALTCGMITMVDDAIGTIVEALERTGRAEDTVIIFNSDHGDYLGDYNMLLKGAVMLRAINNVPFIWSDPKDRTGRVSESLASTVDIAPTVIARAGLKPYFGIQGRSLLPAIDGSSVSRERILIEHQDNTTRLGFVAPCMARTLITESFRLTVYKGESWGELFDLRHDPNESYNLWDDPSHYRVRSLLLETLAQEMMENIDQSPRARRRA
jgi:arylsulfatase A-like enzyme